MATKFKLLISYDGTPFSGWQIQPNSLSIQELIEKALHTVVKQPIRIVGAGRTDAGVHARGQTAHFCCTLPHLTCQQLLYALNGLLPQEIRIKSLEPIDESFHAQYSALKKEYHYHVWTEKVIDPFVQRFRHHFSRKELSLDTLSQAATYFVGTHDFASFTNAGGSTKTTVRTIYRIAVKPQEGGFRLEFEGNGFLYKMVRNLVGTLLEVAISKRDLEQLPMLLAAKNRTLTGVAAPAKGLFLEKITY